MAARLLESPAGVTFVYSDVFMEWDEASRRLSRDLKCPVLSCHIHDGDFWMFIRFVRGREAAKFNPIPDYFEELPPAKRAAWFPDAQDIVKHFPIASIDQIAPYLREWPLEGTLDGEKAHPDDEFEYGQDCQLIDFMRRLGFQYPDPGEGVQYRLAVPDSA